MQQQENLPEMPVPAKDQNLLEAMAKEIDSKLKNKSYADANIQNSDMKIGDMVMVRQKQPNKHTPKFDPNPMKIIAKKGNMVSAENDARCTTRNTSHFKKVSSSFEGAWFEKRQAISKKKEEEKNKAGQAERLKDPIASILVNIKETQQDIAHKQPVLNQHHIADDDVDLNGAPVNESRSESDCLTNETTQSV